MANEIKLVLTIDGKQAIAEVKNTDAVVKSLYQSFKYGKQEINGLTTAISQGFTNARDIIQGFKETYSAITSIVNASLVSYLNQERANIQLATALKQTGNYTNAAYQSLQQYASQLQQTTTFGDDQYISVMAQLHAMGLNTKQTKEATIQTANLAALMGTDLNSAARIMADTFNGNAGMIGRYIKGLDESVIKSGDLNAIINLLNASIGGQAEALGETSYGAVIKFNNAIDDLKENVGQATASVFMPFVNHIKDVAVNLNNTAPQIVGIIGALTTLGAATAVLNTTGLLTLIVNIRGVGNTLKYASGYMKLAAAEGIALRSSLTAAGIAAKGFMASIGPAGWILLGFTVLVEVINFLSNKTDEAADKQNKLNAAFKAMELDSLREELKKANAVINETGSQLESLNSQRKKLFNTDSANLDAIKNKNDEIAVVQNNYNKLLQYRSELLSVIKEKEEEIKLSVEAQYKALRDKLDIDLAGTDTQKAIESANKEFENQKAILKEKHKLDEAGLKNNKDYLDAEKAHHLKIRDIKNKAAKQQNNDAFNNAKSALAETQRHVQSMLKLEADNDLLQLQLKIKHFDEMILLYQKFGEKTTGLINQRIEAEKELELKRKPSVIATEYQLEGEAEPLKDVLNIEEYKKSIRIQSRLDEIENWKNTELERLAMYEDSIEAQSALDEEYTRRKNELNEQITEEQINAAANAFSAIGGMVGRHTVLGQMAAITQTLYNTYEAAAKALTAGPIIGPILAGIITTLGLAQVANIKNTPPPTGYEKGGRFRKGERGLIEGYHDEIIAPEKTFIDVFKNELRPQIYAGFNNGRLESILLTYINKVDGWAKDLRLKTKLSGRDILIATNRAQIDMRKNGL
jgi:hypothetical protein